MKDGKMRFEAPGRGGMGAMVIAPVNQKMLIMMTAQKMRWRARVSAMPATSSSCRN